MKQTEVQSTKCDVARDYLEELIQHLDELDEVDYFGNEGWRKFLMGDE